MWSNISLIFNYFLFFFFKFAIKIRCTFFIARFGSIATLAPLPQSVPALEIDEVCSILNDYLRTLNLQAFQKFAE